MVHPQRRKSAEIIERCERRARMWQQFVANYQWVLAKRPDEWEQYAADFRASWLAA
jgi:hypothetical protein